MQKLRPYFLRKIQQLSRTLKRQIPKQVRDGMLHEILPKLLSQTPNRHPELSFGICLFCLLKRQMQIPCRIEIFKRLNSFEQMSVTQINAREAFELLKKDTNSALIDVRTFEEFNFVGFVEPQSFGNRLVLLPWQLFPEMKENPEFANDLEASLEKVFGKKTQDSSLLFICRTGARSNAAAAFAINLGYKNCFNVVSGFEGDLNRDGHRGQVNGWKAENLPWRQK